jgi:hypothetical protein
MTDLNNEVRELNIDELDAVTGGFGSNQHSANGWNGLSFPLGIPDPCHGHVCVPL